jgi:hypothetical protein
MLASRGMNSGADILVGHSIGRQECMPHIANPLSGRAVLSYKVMIDRFAAAVAELADALDSGSSDRKVVEVQVLSAALVRVIAPPIARHPLQPVQTYRSAPHTLRKVARFSKAANLTRRQDDIGFSWMS